MTALLLRGTKDAFFSFLTIITLYSIMTSSIATRDTQSASVFAFHLSASLGVRFLWISAPSSSSQRIHREVSVAWGWRWDWESPDPALNPRRPQGQRSPWSHSKALASSGRCPDWAMEGATLSHRERGRGRTGAPIHRGLPQKCREDSSSSSVEARAVKSERRSGCGFADCQPATRNQRKWTRRRTGTPPRRKPPPSGDVGRPTRSKGGGGAKERCGLASQRYETSSTPSNKNSHFLGSPLCLRSPLPFRCFVRHPVP